MSINQPRIVITATTVITSARGAPRVRRDRTTAVGWRGVGSSDTGTAGSGSNSATIRAHGAVASWSLFTGSGVEPRANRRRVHEGASSSGVVDCGVQRGSRSVMFHP